jgi:hypothetical protein
MFGNMVVNGRPIPAITKEVKELIEAIRVASLSGRLSTEAVILGICRRNRSGSLRRTKHIWETVKQNPHVFRKKSNVDPHGGRASLILLKPDGYRLLDLLETHNEIVHPVSLSRRQKHPGAPTLYVLEAYYVGTDGLKRPLTMLFRSKLLFLEQGDIEAVDPTRASEVIGEIRCMWRQCVGEVLDFQNPQPVATLPHVKHLVRYVVSRFRVDSICKSSELEFACLLQMKRIFPGTEETMVEIGRDRTPVLRVPITDKEEVYICRRCKSTSCYHLDRLRRRQSCHENLAAGT